MPADPHRPSDPPAGPLYARDVARFAAGFRGLTAPLGVVAVASNHYTYAGWDKVRAGLEAIGGARAGE